jgi:hypothetical protein
MWKRRLNKRVEPRIPDRTGSNFHGYIFNLPQESGSPPQEGKPAVTGLRGTYVIHKGEGSSR